MLGSSTTPRGERPLRGRAGGKQPFQDRPLTNDTLARVARAADRLSDRLNGVATVVAALLLFVMATTVVAQVFFRYVLENSLSWSEELSRYCFVWLSLLGASIAMKRGMHPALGGIGRVLPDRFRPYVYALCKLAAAYVLWVLFREGLELARFNMRQTSPAMGLPMGIPYGAIPVASGIMLVHLLSSFLRPGAAPTAQSEPDGPTGEGAATGAVGEADAAGTPPVTGPDGTGPTDLGAPRQGGEAT